MDIAISYNPQTAACGLVFTGRDFALDATPASAMIFTLLARRRARPDDVAPVNVPDYTNPVSFTARGGWCGDGLDPAGALVGSRMWLLGRRLADEAARLDAETYLAEAFAWFESIRNLAVQIAVRYLPLAPQFLAYRVRVGNTTISLTQALT